MAYTDIDKPTDYFETITYTGTGSSQNITGLDFAPDWVWIKCRSASKDHMIFDTIRSVQKSIRSNSSNAEDTGTNFLSSFDSGGFTAGGNGKTNGGSSTYVSWNWSAGGSAPAITYTVKVVSDSGNKYRFDDFGTSAVTLDLQEGGTYTFDQSDSSNAGHPLRFSTTSNGTHGGGSEYTTGVTTTGTPGNSGAKTVITVGSGVATLYYYCTQHSAMGGQANTNSTFGSSNFSGSIQSTVSAGITQGMSIVSYTGTGSNATVGHGLSSAPSMIIFKARGTANWLVYHQGIGNTHGVFLNTTSAKDDDATYFQDTNPTSSVFSIGTSTLVNDTNPYIAYCFAEKKGYSKFGSYTGNGDADGTFVYTGFKPAFFICKRYNDSGYDWLMYDNKRQVSFNVIDDFLKPNLADAETTGNANQSLDFLSNGVKHRGNGASSNGSGASYIYMAFAENPFVNSNAVPTNAR